MMCIVLLTITRINTLTDIYIFLFECSKYGQHKQLWSWEELWNQVFWITIFKTKNLILMFC